MQTLKVLFEIFLVFFKIGGFTIGGGLAMLPLIQKEVVDRKKWVSEEEILDIFAITQSVPGVIAINSAIFIGNKVYGFRGALVAALGVILPSFVSILLVISILARLQGNPYVEKVFAGIRASATALILLTAIKLGKSAVKGKTGYMILLVSFALIVFFDIHAVWAIVFGGITGYLIYRYNRRNKEC